MTEILEDVQLSTEGRKLYSSRSIGIATFLGTPLATGFLMRENYITLGRPEKGNNAMIIGLIATLFIFGILFLLPEAIINKIPNATFPVVYTGFTYLIVSKTQGAMLARHKELGDKFYSAWRAVGVGLICAVLTLGAAFAIAYFTTDDSYIAKYDEGISTFTANEQQGLAFYDHLSTKSNYALIRELDETVLPKWKANVEILKQLNDLGGLPPELIRQNEILLEYSQLRIQAFQLIRRDLDDPTVNHDVEINRLHSEIDKKLKELN